MLESITFVMAGVLTRVIAETGCLAAVAYFVWHRLRDPKVQADVR